MPTSRHRERFLNEAISCTGTARCLLSIRHPSPIRLCIKRERPSCFEVELQQIRRRCLGDLPNPPNPPWWENSAKSAIPPWSRSALLRSGLVSSALVKIGLGERNSPPMTRGTISATVETTPWQFEFRSQSPENHRFNFLYPLPTALASCRYFISQSIDIVLRYRH